jgi:hypothetical protein
MDEFAVSWHAAYYKLKYILSNSKSLHLLKQKDHMISTFAKCPREMEDLNFSMFGSIIAVFVLIFFHLKPNLEKKLYLFKQFLLVRIQFYLFQAPGKWVSAKTVIGCVLRCPRPRIHHVTNHCKMDYLKICTSDMPIR